jgi:exopolyphosphatase
VVRFLIFFWLNKDLDSATCAVATAWFATLRASGIGQYLPILAIPRADLTLRPELLQLFKETGIDSDDVCTLENIENIDTAKTSLFLLDHNVPRGRVSDLFNFETTPSKVKVKGIIDHHEDERAFAFQLDSMEQFDIQKSGSCASLVTQWMKNHASESNKPELIRQHPHEASGVAQLLLAAILIDTANLSNSKTTDIDRSAVQFLATLLPDFGTLDFYNQIKTAKMSIDGMTFRDLLRRDYKEYDSPLGRLGMSTIIRSIPDLRHQFENFKDELLAYIHDRKLAVHIIMTIQVNEGSIRRGGMIVSNNDEVVQQFKSRGEQEFQMSAAENGLQKLVEGLPEGWTSWTFEQGDLNSSRKQVAPFAMDILHKVGKQEK